MSTSFDAEYGQAAIEDARADLIDIANQINTIAEKVTPYLDVQARKDLQVMVFAYGRVLGSLDRLHEK